MRFTLFANADATFAEPAPRIALLAVGWMLGLSPAAAGGAPLRRAPPLVVLIACFSRGLVVLLGGEAFAGAAALAVWLLTARLIMLAAPRLGSALIALGVLVFLCLRATGTASPGPAATDDQI